MISPGFCLHCNQPIEFDTGSIGTSAACPHCQQSTVLIASNLPAKRKEKPALPENVKAPSANLMLIGVALLFLVSCGMVFSGCSGELSESSNPNGSAIRQNVYAVQYGCGFLLMAASLILNALCRIITEK